MDESSAKIAVTVLRKSLIDKAAQIANNGDNVTYLSSNGSTVGTSDRRVQCAYLPLSHAPYTTEREGQMVYISTFDSL